MADIQSSDSLPSLFTTNRSVAGVVSTGIAGHGDSFRIFSSASPDGIDQKCFSAYPEILSSILSAALASPSGEKKMLSAHGCLAGGSKDSSPALDG